jgi:hypothetical protein
MASSQGYLAVVQVLVRAGAEKEVKDMKGWTPLMWASGNGHLEVVLVLVRAGVEKEAKAKNGVTPLIGASGNGHLVVVQVLVQAGANVATAATNGKTAEQYALDQGHTAVADLLHRHLEEKAEQAMASLLLLDDDTGNRTSDGQGQAAKKAKSNKTKKAKQKLRESKALHAAAAGAALAAAQQAQGQDEDRKRQQRVRDELLRERAEVVAQEQEFTCVLALQEKEADGRFKQEQKLGEGGGEEQLQKHQPGKTMATPQSSSPQQTQQQQQQASNWECHECTFLNPPLAQVCGACEAAHVNVQAATQQQELPQKQRPATAPAAESSEAAATSEMDKAACAGDGVGSPVELLECPVCIGCYAAPPSKNAPVSLPCGHSVCKQCAEDLQAAALRCRTSGGPLRIACPSCCRQLDLPLGGAKSLPVNYALAHAAQAIKDAARKMSECERAAAPAAALAAPADRTWLPAAAPALVCGPNVAAEVAVQSSPTATTCAGAGAGAHGGGGADGSSGAGDYDGASGGGIGLAGLLKQLQFTSAQIAGYVPALTEAGYDLIEDLATATTDQLSVEAGMKTPHARRVTMHFSH